MQRIEIEEYLIRKTKRWLNRSDLDCDHSGNNEDIAIVIIVALQHLDITTASIVEVTQDEIDKVTDDSLFLNLCEYFLLDTLTQYVCGETYQAVSYRIDANTACTALHNRMTRVKGFIDNETNLLQELPVLDTTTLDLQIDENKPK